MFFFIAYAPSLKRKLFRNEDKIKWNTGQMKSKFFPFRCVYDNCHYSPLWFDSRFEYNLHCSRHHWADYVRQGEAKTLNIVILDTTEVNCTQCPCCPELFEDYHIRHLQSCLLSRPVLFQTINYKVFTDFIMSRSTTN